MDFDPLILSRIQFAANITFHILFPSITIALGWILLFFKLRYARSGDYKWMESYFFWTKIFALCFALGVVTGITMSFQFGTNWPGYMLKVGNVAGPLLAYEVLTAFFLEATFLGIMFFGFRRVPSWLHSLATFLVAFGTTLSTFWIVSLNSWMQTPAGHEIVDGVVYAKNWLEIIFNPSMPYRLTHMLLASGLTASFVVAGVSAYRWLKEDRKPAVLSALRTSVYLAAFLIPVQIVVGDMHGLNTLEHQPAKIAAMEALWETRTEAPLVLFALPDAAGKTNRWVFEVPGLASLILAHDLAGEIKGLNEFKEHPPVAPLFWGFRIMVGMGLLMLLVSWTAALRLFRKGDLSPFLARVLVGMTFSGWVAVVAGWYVTEIGRQPYLVYGVLRTADAVGPVAGGTVAFSLAAYLALYAFLLVAFVTTLFYMAAKARPLEDNDPVNPVQGDWGAVAAGEREKHAD
jgi:cytochrome bd ubiquinol oxidase subunit I